MVYLLSSGARQRYIFPIDAGTSKAVGTKCPVTELLLAQLGQRYQGVNKERRIDYGYSDVSEARKSPISMRPFETGLSSLGISGFLFRLIAQLSCLSKAIAREN